MKRRHSFAESDTLDALALLKMFLELKDFTPDVEDWSEAKMNGNPPRLYRLCQLMSLFAAFEIPWDLKSFIGGNFIDTKSSKLDRLANELSPTMHAFEDWERKPEIVRRGFPMFFNILLGYRIEIDRVLNYSSGVLESSGLFGVAYELTHDVNEKIPALLERIDKILSELIDPEMRSFSVSELVSNFGFPNVDLFEIDCDWI